MRRNAEIYLVVWDKPGTRSAPGRFYRDMKEKLSVKFIQRSVYGAKNLKSALRLTKLAKRYGLKVIVFRAEEVAREPSARNF